MNTEVKIVLGSLLGGALLVWLILFLFSPNIAWKRKIYIFFMLMITSVGSTLAFYKVLPLPIWIYLTSTVFIYWLSMVKPALRPLWFRIVISWPSALYTGVCLLSLPVLTLQAFVDWKYWWILYVVIAVAIVFGFIQSSYMTKEFIYFSAIKKDAHMSSGKTEEREGLHQPKLKLRRENVLTYSELQPGLDSENTLKIAQITDPHIGINMSKERLYEICETIASWNPDIVVVTGDMISVESYREGDNIAEAFSPLTGRFPGRLFACLGNHDYESLPEVERALRKAGIRLLKDEKAVAETSRGPIEIVGIEFNFSRRSANRRNRIADLVERFGDKEYFRVWLVHNPEEFTYFPDGAVDLMLSGHTHGGQIGLQTFGLNFTFYNLFKRSPDFGLWKKGTNLLYVHRGTGFQGFPVRLGVSGEFSLLNVSM